MKHLGSQDPSAAPVCWKCGDRSHLEVVCLAAVREEHIIEAWNPEMVDAVKVFFPSKRTEGMSEEDFDLLVCQNIAKDELVGKHGQ